MSKPFDLLTVGDCAIDAFIRLKEARVHCRLDQERCEICMNFGDKIPYEFAEEVAGVGNSANAAVCAARLGLSAALLSDTGKDTNGERVISSLSGNRVHTGFIRSHPGKFTNYHYVLWYEEERTILVKHEAYERKLPEFEEPLWLYLSSLGADSLAYHRDIEKYLLAHPRVKFAFQPGTFQIKLGVEALKLLYKRADILFLNTEEAQSVLGKKNRDLGSLLRELHTHGPKIVIITDGPKGAYIYDGKTMGFMPAYPDTKPPLERTGAGDAFASSVVSALALGKSLEEGFRSGMVNAMSVVQHVGAQEGLLTQADIAVYLKKAPVSFKMQKFI